MVGDPQKPRHRRLYGWFRRVSEGSDHKMNETHRGLGVFSDLKYTISLLHQQHRTNHDLALRDALSLQQAFPYKIETFDGFFHQSTERSSHLPAWVCTQNEDYSMPCAISSFRTAGAA